MRLGEEPYDSADQKHHQTRTEGLRRGMGHAAQRSTNRGARGPPAVGKGPHALLKEPPDSCLHLRGPLVEVPLGLGEPGEIEHKERENAGPAHAEHVAIGRMQRIDCGSEALAPCFQTIARGASGDAQGSRDVGDRPLFEVVHDEHEARAAILDRLDQMIHEAPALPARDPLDQAGIPDAAGPILRFIREQLPGGATEPPVSSRGVVGDLADLPDEINARVTGVQLQKGTEKGLLRDVRLIRFRDA